MKKRVLIIAAILGLCSCGQRIFVSENGDDNNAGSRKSPLATIGKAFEIAGNRKSGVAVFLRGGRYEIPDGLRLDSVCNLSVSAYRDEKVIVSGGVRLSAEDFRRIDDASVAARLDPSVRERALMLDFQDNPEAFHGLTAKGFGRPPHSSWSELIVNGRPLTLARWPKDREIQIQKVYCAGVTPRRGTVQTTPPKLPEIRIDNDEVYSFSGDEGLWLWGYFSASYAEDMIPVAEIDSAGQRMKLGLTTKYGFSKCYEGGEHKRWAMMNVLEEMTEPGEYVLDSESKRMYFIPPEEGMRDVELTMLDTAMVTLTGCSGVIFRNITFQGGRNDGIVMEGCSDCVLENCVIRGVGRLAVHIGPGAYAVRNGLRRCEIYDVGSGGVELFGGDRLSLTPGECFVENCRIHNVNRMDKSYRPAVKFAECGNRVSHCEIYDAPSMAILLNGNNQLVEYCDIHDVCRQIADQAAIYYGRNPTERGSRIRYSYIHDVHSGFKKWIFGIYHDDGACGVDVYGCIFNNIETSGANIGGGSDISYTNCIFMNSVAALSIDDRNAINGKEGSYCAGYRKKFENVRYQEAPYVNEYPELKNYYEEQPENPKRIEVRNNIYYKVDRIWEAYVLHSRHYLHGYEKYPFDIDSNPGLIDGEDPMKGLDMERVREILPDFQPIPFEKIGVCHE